jgi:hypothetical protein
MDGFKIICCKCGSDKIVEKCENQVLELKGNKIFIGEGISIKCIECSNKDFLLLKTIKL